MYLSHLLINTGDNPDRPRPGRLWLRNRYRVHQRLCMAFPSEARRSGDPAFLAPYCPEDFATEVHVARSGNAGFLFRVDPLTHGRAVILVQSSKEPDWTYAFHNADYLLAAPPEVRILDARVAEGDSFRFRLQANPTRKIKTKTGDDGKRNHGTRVPVRSENLVAWLRRKGNQSGFCIDEASLMIEAGYVYFRKDWDEESDTEQNTARVKAKVKGGRLFSVTYQGTLRVTDQELFARALASGIGPAKGFGFGLLSVVPFRE